MPLSISRPDDERVRRFLDAQRARPFGYGAVGATLTTPPPGFDVDHNRCELGRGEPCFERARDALRRWRMFDLGWVGIANRDAPIERGVCVAVLARQLRLWSLNACRIVATIDERTDGTRRFGFAYGTLPGHVECGEERFLVELDTRIGVVTYDILAFSRPRAPWARALRPWIRTLQRRFARDSMAAMRRCAGEEGSR